MRILHISDTHNHHQQLTNLPEADIIIHSGDFTFSGSEEEALEGLTDGIHYESKVLLDKARQISPKAPLFGHIHDTNGIKKDNEVIFSNSVIVNSQYNVTYQARINNRIELNQN